MGLYTDVELGVTRPSVMSVKVWFEFTHPPPTRERVELVVIYRQPCINAVGEMICMYK